MAVRPTSDLERAPLARSGRLPPGVRSVSSGTLRGRRDGDHGRLGSPHVSPRLGSTGEAWGAFRGTGEAGQVLVDEWVRCESRTPSTSWSGGGGGNRTLSRPFRETAAARDFRDQIEEGQRVNRLLVALSRPLESPGVLLSLGEIVESGGRGVPAPADVTCAQKRRTPIQRPAGRPLNIRRFSFGTLRVSGGPDLYGTCRV